MSRVGTPQSGIFALGTASHAYLEFDAVNERSGAEVVAAIASLREPRTTMGGVNLVAGLRPELWRGLSPDEAPAPVDVVGFDSDVVGADGFVMPATQHDAVPSLSGSAYDVVVPAIESLARLARSAYPSRES
jgi:porphyrinogen peroxidase